MQYTQVNSGWECLLCNIILSSRQAVTSHIHRSHTNPGVSYGGHRKGVPAWNKGLNKETDERVAKNALSISVATKGRPGRKHTNETKEKLSKIMSVNNRGGRCKWYTVSGQKVQGTWEKNIANKFDELGIHWEKLKTNNHTFEYVMNGKNKNYTPDFFLKHFDVYLEIKGYWWGQDRLKMDIILEKYKEKRIVIIEKNEYEAILRGEQVW